MKWTLQHTRILMYSLKNYSHREIGEKVGMSHSTVGSIMLQDEFKRRQEKLTRGLSEQIQDIFTNNAKSAARRMCAIAKKGKPGDRVQLEACKEVLAQIGLKPPEIIETRSRDYTPQEVESARKVLDEMTDITKRLSTDKSLFIIKKETTSPSREETPTPTIPDEPRPEGASQDRQDTLSA